MLTSRLAQLRSDDEQGATLVELLVVILLTSVIGSLLTISLVTGMRGVSATQVRYDGLAEMQTAVDRMARELRAADPVEYAASAPADSVDKAVVTIYRDAPTFNNPRRYTYLYCPPAGSTSGRVHVRLETTTPGVPLPAVPAMSCPSSQPVLIDDIDNGADPVFAFLEQDGDPAVASDEVFQMEVTLKRSLSDQNPIEVTTSVRVRNAR